MPCLLLVGLLSIQNISEARPHLDTHAGNPSIIVGDELSTSGSTSGYQVRGSTKKALDLLKAVPHLSQTV